jgi:hypothetical protein
VGGSRSAHNTGNERESSSFPAGDRPVDSSSTGMQWIEPFLISGQDKLCLVSHGRQKPGIMVGPLNISLELTARNILWQMPPEDEVPGTLVLVKSVA